MIASWICCPRCRAALVDHTDTLVCSGCAVRYPVVGGLPDLRVSPDPWLDMAGDRSKGLQVATDAPPGFEAAVRYYWTLTPDTPSLLADRHVDHVLHAEGRTREWLAELEPPPAGGERWLDVGCGTADLAVSVPPGVEVVGIDIAFRWLCIARRRLADSQRAAVLICGNAEALPAGDASFDRVCLLGTIEHCADLEAVMAEARRVLRPGGHLHVRTVNRFSLLPEPHVNLWGVGFLPRGMADTYVRWRGRGRYQHHWPRTAGQLVRAMSRGGFRAVEVVAARPLTSEIRRLPSLLRPVAGLYRRVRRWPVMRLLAPVLEGRGSIE